MELSEYASAIKSVEDAGISVCVLGEVTLNYYNVSRVIHDVELCVPHDSFEEAQSILEASIPCKPEELEDFDLFNKYKQGWPRSRPTAADAASSPTFGIVLFSDNSQILESLPARDVHLFPMPQLPRLMTSLCKTYIESGDVMARIGVEQLIDGMDLDEAWCQRNLSSTASDEVQQLVLSVVQGKKWRIDDFSGKSVTCFIADEEEATRMHGIPGYEQ
ncbi:uncharacterized protein IWZ02DRAFT_469110 [Phyllosticta citriasiana]|uniref:uncharacterized protein n=1 Tax=Phyllosticta citriasiana TaxID=595635 RepID=UPI0030FD2AB3